MITSIILFAALTVPAATAAWLRQQHNSEAQRASEFEAKLREERDLRGSAHQVARIALRTDPVWKCIQSASESKTVRTAARALREQEITDAVASYLELLSQRERVREVIVLIALLGDEYHRQLVWGEENRPNWPEKVSWPDLLSAALNAPTADELWKAARHHQSQPSTKVGAV